MSRRKTVVWTIVGVVGAIVATVLVVRLHHWRPRSLTIQGAVIRRDGDSRKESPISDAKVTASDGVTSASTQSDASGYFKVKFPEAVLPGQTLNLTFEHADYDPLELKLPTGLRLASRGLYVAAMTPTPQESDTSPNSPVSVVSNVVVRYTVNSKSDQNVGSAVKTFQVVNGANVTCNGKPPCSPDGNWKASKGSVSLDAGPGSEFRNVRASCIAGPCPFTRIDSAGFVDGGRNITATALDWSDTATFLLEAEVFRTGMASHVRLLYPVLFGKALHFTLPPTEEGVTIEADINGKPMVFPLGPELYLSWATCTARTNNDQEKTTVYRCELKPGYSF
jgi:hypothetical protein